MLAMHVTSLKLFMSQLLASDAFDIFLLKEATVSAADTVTIDGRLNRDFYSPEELEDMQAADYGYIPWHLQRGLCFQLIKGKHTPLSFKFIFHLKPELLKRLLEKEGCAADISFIDALVLTVRYDGGKITLTTGCAYRSFLLSKEPEQVWDRFVSRYLAEKNVPCAED